MDDIAKAGEFWDREIHAPTHVSWMDAPEILRAIQERIGSEEKPSTAGDWFVARLNGRTFRRGLSIGCGIGNLEREAIRRGLCDSIDAFDGSIQSLRVAHREAEREGWSDRIRYFVSDFNRPVLPRDVYDIVFFNQSLHHVANLEGLFRELLRAMTPDAIMYIDEYVGPSRSDWNDALIAPHRAVFAQLPAEVRKGDFLALPIQPDDPSEAIRSSEILEQLKVGFHIDEVRAYGGNLLAVLYPFLDWPRLTEELKRRLIDEDRAMSRRGSYYVVVVARPSKGLRRDAASIRWTIAEWRRRKRD